MLVFRYPEPLLALSQAPPALADKVRAYLAVAAWGAPAGLAFRLFASYTTAVSLPRVMMALNLLGLALKVPLNWMFIFGHSGAPELGATGCALSTALVNWIICLLAWICAAASPPNTGAHRVFARWSWPRWRDQRHLIALGVPIGVTFLVDVTAFTFMALFVARLGAVNSAAHQIAANVAAVMYMLPLAVGNARRRARRPGDRRARVRARALDRRRRHRARPRARCVASAATLATGAAAIAAFYSTDVNVQAVAAACSCSWPATTCSTRCRR